MECDAVVAQVLESSKYRTLCPDVIRRVAEREIARSHSLKEAVKATKNTLHQIAGAYLEGKPKYSHWAQTTADTGEVERLALAREWMRHHASTAERLPFVEDFYRALFTEVGSPISSVLDVACGLNPLAISFMPLPAHTQYFACDIFSDQAEFLNKWMTDLDNISGSAEVRDVISNPPTETADVALVLKLLPVLEQWDKNAGINLLRALNCPTLIVSFPTRSLSGKSKGMADNYAARFLAQIEPEGWHSVRFDFPNELAFVVRK